MSSFEMRAYRKGDCKGWFQHTRTKYTCSDPLAYGDYCEKHLPYDLRKEREYVNTPLEKRQEYLDHIKAGKSIGEAYTLAGISFEAALAITDKAITTHQYFQLNYQAQP